MTSLHPCWVIPYMPVTCPGNVMFFWAHHQVTCCKETTAARPPFMHSMTACVFSLGIWNLKYQICLPPPRSGSATAQMMVAMPCGFGTMPRAFWRPCIDKHIFPKYGPYPPPCLRNRWRVKQGINKKRNTKQSKPKGKTHTISQLWVNTIRSIHLSKV